MGQFIKFTFASCLGVFIAMILLFFVVMMIAVGAASAGKATPVEANSVLKIDLDYTVPELTNNNPSVSFSLSEESVLGMREIIDLIRNAQDDDRIKGIYLYPTYTALGTTQTAQLSEALDTFRASGKWVIAYAEYFSQPAYALAAHADTILLNPIGSVDFRGYASFVPFFKELLDKTGIRMQVYYAGDFKSATEPFRRTEMSPENRLQTRQYLDTAYQAYLQGVASGRGLSVEQLYEIADTLGSRNAQDAVRLGLVDQIGYEDEVFSWMRGKLGLGDDKKVHLLSLAEYAGGAKATTSTAKDRIAVIYAEGEIHAGEVDYGTIGDERYVEILQKVRKDERIKAVVLRVNSPGGSILASENILRELKLLKDADKPLVVSMGDYAASGGYYISAPADSIFAEPTTLTGSIGVFSMMPNLQDLLNNKLGIHFDTVRTGAYSASFTPFYPWTEGEDRYLQQRTDEYYEMFLTHVSNFRQMTREEVHAIAQGRIWSGMDAVSNGLVDRIGDLDDALKSAATLAGLESYRISDYPKVPNQLSRLLSQLTGEETTLSEQVIERRLTQEVPHYQEIRSLLEIREPVARLPLILDY